MTQAWLHDFLTIAARSSMLPSLTPYPAAHLSTIAEPPMPKTGSVKLLCAPGFLAFPRARSPIHLKTRNGGAGARGELIDLQPQALEHLHVEIAERRVPG
jgi:hypothetical protein